MLGLLRTILGLALLLALIGDSCGQSQQRSPNHGKTSGEILEYGIGWCEADRIPSMPTYEWFHYRDNLGPGTQSRGIDKPIPIPKNLERPAIYGRYGYRDIFGVEHTDGFIQEGGTPLLAPKPFTESDPPLGHPRSRKA
jgi:hypothetical protein